MTGSPKRDLVKLSKKNFLITLIGLFILQIAGCKVNNVPALNKPTASETVATDYSKAEHWLSTPATADKKVDVFYLYPTAWMKTATSDPNICEIDNASMLTGSKAAFGRHSPVFTPIANVYAPYYRQADAFYTLGLTADARAKVMAGIPLLDATAAFDYYLRHYNNGRPFILAGHSQGSNVLMYLLAGYLKDNSQVYNRMIAAYLVGCSVTDSYLSKNPHLKFAEGPDDLGVIISYNTQSPDLAAGANLVVEPGAIAINPISWTREETLAQASESLGSMMPASGSVVKIEHYADARVDKAKGVVICSTADADFIHAMNPALPRGMYHSFDYPLYFYDLRENMTKRIAKYSSLHGL